MISSRVLEMDNTIALADKYMFPTYKRFPITLVRGEGCRVWDENGKEYLDFVGGIAVCALGHSSPLVAEALEKQSRRLVHVSNLYYTKPQTDLARLLVENSFADRVFFCNSGAEANEAAIKIARRYSREKFGPGRHTIIAMANSFHGRTMGTLSATGQSKIQVGYEPQVVMGRTGWLFAHEHYGVTPHIMSLAKALGNGLPIGAMLAVEELSGAFGPGSHATTFGGTPLVTAASLAVVRSLLEDGWLEHCRRMGEYFQVKLKDLQARHPAIREVRGLGLILGIELDGPGAPIVEACMEKGFLVNCVQDKVIRFVPPLIVDEREVDLLVKALDEALGEVR
jgi:acetylornithine/succinyldiaminopimelate/putrescine aminotransferase